MSQHTAVPSYLRVMVAMWSGGISMSQIYTVVAKGLAQVLVCNALIKT